VTPFFKDGRVAAILSLHQLGEPRRWTGDEIRRCRDTAQAIGARL
jgi:hypothetical protein